MQMQRQIHVYSIYTSTSIYIYTHPYSIYIYIEIHIYIYVYIYMHYIHSSIDIGPSEPDSDFSELLGGPTGSGFPCCSSSRGFIGYTVITSKDDPSIR